MSALRNFLVDFLTREDGPTVVEYAVMLALIILVCLGAIGVIGSKTNTNFNAIPLGDALSSS